MITWVGGTCGVPSACRKKESTITILVKQVVMTRSAGRNAMIVRKSNSSTGELSPKKLGAAAAGTDWANEIDGIRNNAVIAIGNNIENIPLNFQPKMPLIPDTGITVLVSACFKASSTSAGLSFPRRVIFSSAMPRAT